MDIYKLNMKTQASEEYYHNKEKLPWSHLKGHKPNGSMHHR